MNPGPEAWCSGLGDLALPAAVVDLDAFDRNVGRVRGWVADRPGIDGAPIAVRWASKSLRCADLLDRAAAATGWRSILAFTADEALFWSDRGTEDVLLAYPPATRRERVALGRASGTVRVAIDDEAHLDGLDVAVGLCLDLDASLRVAGQHLGARRSPLRSVDAAVRLAEQARARGFRVEAVMVYESAVAGLADAPAGRAWLAPALRWVKARSAVAAATLRREATAALRAAGHDVRIVNGGGTGSLRTTPGDLSTTEVAVGSALFAPHTFDGFAGLGFEPSLFLVHPVCRVPGPGFVTVSGGGVMASGAAGPDRLPRPVVPPGARLLPDEGFGEVQTPIALPPGVTLRVGDPVVFRPAKAGEGLDHHREVILVSGGRVVGAAPTVRVADLAARR